MTGSWAAPVQLRLADVSIGSSPAARDRPVEGLMDFTSPDSDPRPPQFVVQGPGRRGSAHRVLVEWVCEATVGRCTAPGLVAGAARFNVGTAWSRVRTRESQGSTRPALMA